MFPVLIVVLVLLVYAWILYPVVVLLVGRARRTHPRPLQGGEQERMRRQELPSSEGLGVGFFPPVAILFSAHNEEAVILKRLENLAALDYPADRLQIFVGVDGGSDRTAEIALEWARTHPNVHVIVSRENHGKTGMLKRLVGEVDRETSDHRHQTAEEISSKSEVCGLKSEVSLLAFTDANTVFAPDALRHLVAPFADPKVGGVCGRLVLVNEETAKETTDHRPQTAGQSEAPPDFRSKVYGLRSKVCSASCGGTDESTYWNLETRLKVAESSLDSCLGANGAIYAIRSDLFPAHFPDNTIIDDFVIGMKVREQGYRLLYEPAAVATEELPATVQDEWRRRVRIGAGAYQALVLCWRCLSPRFGIFAWMFWSHKVLRWFTPHLAVLGGWLGGGLLSCWVVELLSKSPESNLSSATQQLSNITTLLCIALAGVLLLTPRGRKGFKLLGYFITMQAAFFVGFLRFCRGGLKGTWERTERGNPHV